MSRANRTRYAILGLLIGASKSGYDLRKELEERTSHFWNESLGQVYPTLRRLHEEGLVVREIQKRDARPDRILYSITEDGRAELERWLVEPSKPQPVRNEQLLRIFLAEPPHAAALITDIGQHRDTYLAQAAAYDGYEHKIGELAPTPERAAMWRLCTGLGRRILDARIAWCEEAMAVLSGIAEEVDQ